ncbi:MAG: FMN-binding protein [Propionibacteriaceae bacterium]|nr:FMN-binding protein [Propionibacteriaceae bacterium]
MKHLLVRVAAGASVAVVGVLGGCSASAGPTSPTTSSVPELTSPTIPRGTGADGTYTGDAVKTPHGNVQVEIVVADRQITDIHVVQCPSDAQRSKDICQQAVPTLVSESLDAQSANVDAVSGATYTSAGYKQSLQSAIDNSGL